GRPPRASSLLAGPRALDVHRVLDRMLAAPAELAERAPEDLQVEPEGPVVEVPEVQVDSLRPADRLAPVHLRPAGDARLDRQAAAVVVGVAGDLLDEIRARPDEAHLAAQHVPELRQLIEAGAAEESAGARDAWVVLDDAERVVGDLRRQ